MLDRMVQIRKVVVGCMDSRVVPEEVLGFGVGEAQVLRVSGGRVTPEVLAGIVASATLFDLHEIVILHHSDCAMGKWTADALREEVTAVSGAKCAMDFPTFTDADAALADDVEAVIRSPHLADDLVVTGVRFDVDTSALSTVVGPIRRGRAADPLDPRTSPEPGAGRR